MMIVRASVGLAGLAFLGLILWAWFTAGGGDGFLRQGEVLLALEWGQVTLADLYLGFFLTAVIVFLVERSIWSALFWALPTFVLGNWWAAIWLVARLPVLIERLRPEAPAPAAEPKAD
jgi:hypothetical protein